MEPCSQKCCFISTIGKTNVTHTQIREVGHDDAIIHDSVRMRNTTLVACSPSCLSARV
jgi:hypothetical protein